jgi:putative transposase
MTLYKNQYRIESSRLKGWDYSSPGYYFITICTKSRECLFGDVTRGRMVLSEIGNIVGFEWLKSFEIRAELLCDEYCIMPNHIHGVVIIKKNVGNDRIGNDRIGNDRIGNDRRDARPCVSTDCIDDTDIVDKMNGINIKRLPRSISSFVAGFKSSATKSINELRHTPGIPLWQPRFHVRIIRDENELNLIRQYIKNNPSNWGNDNNTTE